MSPPLFRIQYASGLFANRGWREAATALKPVPKSSALALLGNCGSFASKREETETILFLKHAAKIWPKIFWIPGPLEYSSFSKAPFYKCIDLMRDSQKGSGPTPLLVMNQTEVYDSVREIVVLGLTGWSPFRYKPFESEIPYPNISFSNGELAPATLKEIRQWNSTDIQWLNKSVLWWSLHRPHVRIIILSHHLCSPYLLSHSMGLSMEFLKNLDYRLMGFEDDIPLRALSNNRLNTWLCGSSSATISGNVGPLGGNYVHGAVNPLFYFDYGGSKSEKKNEGFNGSASIDIP